MSKTAMVVLWTVVVVVVVGGGIWWWVAASNGTPVPTTGAQLPPTRPPTNSSAPSNPSTPVDTGTVSSTPAAASYPQGDSDQSINQDMADMNTQMNGLSSDNASVTQSMNDQPVQQAQ